MRSFVPNRELDDQATPNECNESSEEINNQINQQNDLGNDSNGFSDDNENDNHENNSTVTLGKVTNEMIRQKEEQLFEKLFLNFVERNSFDLNLE